MNSTEDMVNKISVKHAPKIRKLCEPLTTCFGINHFFMSKTLENGQFFSIGSNLKMHEYYYNDRKFVYSPLHRNPAFISGGFYSYRQYKESDFERSLEDVQQKSDCCLLAGLSYNENNSLIRFGFCAPPTIGSENILLLVSQNSHLLHSFISHYKKELEFVIRDAINHSISLPAELESVYNTPYKNHTINGIDIENRLTFLKSIGVIKEKDSFTKRELEYLHHLAKGWTYAQIAKHMHLSPRTVENSFQFLKEKLSCHSKAQLIEIAKHF